MVRLSRLKIALDTDEKREAYRKLKLSPLNKDYYIRLANYCEREGSLKDAGKVLRFALGALPGDRQLAEKLAQIYVKTGDESRAVRLLKQLIRNYPTESWSSYLRLSRLYKERGDLEKAVSVFESIDRDNPLREKTHDYLYTLYFIMKDHDRGIRNLKDAIKLFGENHRRTKDLGKLYMKKGNKAEAINWLRKAVRYEPDDLDALILIGLAYLDAGEYGNARRTFNRVLKLKRGSYAALINLAELSLLQGRLDEARRILARIRRRDPFDSRSKLALGDYWLRKGKPKRAIAVTEKGLGETPFYYPLELVRAHAILGEAYGLLGDGKKEAVHKAISARIRKETEPFEAMRDLAREYRKRGNTEFAEEVLAQLLKTFPGNSLALVELARLRHEAGLDDEAVTLLHAVLGTADDKFTGDREEARKILGRIYRKRGKAGKARKRGSI